MPESSRFQLDNKDRDIVTILQHEGRVSFAELGRRIELSAPAVHARVRRLEEQSLIRGYAALLDRERAGNDVLCFINVSLLHHQREEDERFRNEVLAMPEVLECHHVTGEFDYLLKVIVPNRRALEAFLMDRLTALPQLDKVQTNLVLREVKNETAIPLNV
ncbi:MAG: Lrp/AsnC family transcriptional regulator [Ardenticatenaceae bacterium]|nr:Lrp/AsnC family transcriptional regulator [Ardenticatenaceae bacterium]HBY99385.1 AsnC family transcriptional regulator [Chloroflexota bacterium]